MWSFKLFLPQILDSKGDYNSKLLTLRDKKIDIIAKVGQSSFFFNIKTTPTANTEFMILE
jgi:hypothetical protein